MTPALPIFQLPNALTHGEVDQTLRMFKQSFAHIKGVRVGAALVVDGGHLQRFDSSALAVLLACRRMAKAQGFDLLVHSLPAKLMALAELYGLNGLLINTASETVIPT